MPIVVSQDEVLHVKSDPRGVDLVEFDDRDYLVDRRVIKRAVPPKAPESIPWLEVPGVGYSPMFPKGPRS